MHHPQPSSHVQQHVQQVAREPGRAAERAQHDLILWHEPRPPYAYPLAEERIRLRLRMALDDPRRPAVAWSDRFGGQGGHRVDATAPMRHFADDGRYRYWEAEVVPVEGRVRYVFALEDTSEVVWFGEAGVSPALSGAEWPDGYFHWPYLHRERILDTPAWVRDAVCYEIFPDRFARGNPPIAPDRGRDWPEKPTYDSFWGGDLAGLLDRADYIGDLGVNLLWLTPIFAASTNHKYDTTDYGRIDPHFGDEQLFARLVAEYRRRGIRTVLDGVFNHSGLHFAPWQDVVRRGAASPYWSWFDVRGELPDVKSRNYRTFGHTASMPRLMTANPEVQAYLIEQTSRWMRMGIAGWRLDVADEVDMSFWRRFRREMRAINPEAYFVGEIGYNSARWLEGDQFDGVMQYPLRQALLQFVAPADQRDPSATPLTSRLDAPGFLNTLSRMRSWYPGWATTASLNPLSTHDVPRFLTVVGGDVRRWRLGLIFMLTYEGIPQLYYGDEVGLQGGHDPDSRNPMIWDPAKQNAAMLATTRELVRLRRDYPALRGSGFRPLDSGHPQIAVYLRGTSGAEEVGAASCPPGALALVVLNAGEQPQEIELALGPVPLGGLSWPAESRALDLLSGATHTVVAGQMRLRLAALDAAVLVPA